MIELRLSHSENAKSPILVILFGIVIFLRFLQQLLQIGDAHMWAQKKVNDYIEQGNYHHGKVPVLQVYI